MSDRPEQPASRENVNVVRDQYAATNERDFERAMSHYAPDVELVVPPEVNLLAGTFQGRADVGRWLGEWFSTFDADARFDVEEIVALDEGSVLLTARHHARGRASGIEVEMTVIWLYRLREGKIAHVRGCQTREEALARVDDGAQREVL